MTAHVSHSALEGDVSRGQRRLKDLRARETELTLAAEALKGDYDAKNIDLMAKENAVALSRVSAAFEAAATVAKERTDLSERVTGLLSDSTGTVAAGFEDGEPTHVLPTLAEYQRAIHKATQTIGTDSSGGFLVPQRLFDQALDFLVADSVVLKTSPRMFEFDSPHSQVDVPIVADSTTAGWVAEASQLTPSDVTYEMVSIVPTKCAIYTTISREAMQDSNPAVFASVEADHWKVLSLAVDLALLEGSGADNEPLGIRGLGDATKVELGTTDGAVPTLLDVLGAVRLLEEADANPSHILMHPRTWGQLQAEVDGNARLQLSPDPTRVSERRLFDLPVLTSSQIAIDETVGSSTDCSWLAVVDSSTLGVAVRRPIEILMSEHAHFDSDMVAIRTTTRVGMESLAASAGGIQLLSGLTTA